MDARSKACVGGHSVAGIAVWNPTGGIDVCLLGVLCVVRWNSLRRADHPSRGILLNVVCPAVCDLETSTIRRPWPTTAVEP
jgi:hypothetical protein